MNRQEINAAIGLTEDEIDALASDYELDKWDASHLGRVSPGRPSLYDERIAAGTLTPPRASADAARGDTWLTSRPADRTTPPARRATSRGCAP